MVPNDSNVQLAANFLDNLNVSFVYLFAGHPIYLTGCFRENDAAELFSSTGSSVSIADLRETLLNVSVILVAAVRRLIGNNHGQPEVVIGNAWINYYIRPILAVPKVN